MDGDQALVILGLTGILTTSFLLSRISLMANGISLLPHSTVAVLLYLDCAVLATVSISYNTACSSTLSLFKSVGAGYNELYGGSIDDIRIYNTSKTTANLSSIASCCYSPPGSYCALFYGDSTPCAAGSFQNLSGALSCTLCPGGTYSEQSGAVSISACQPCPGGHYCPSNTSSWARLNCGRGNFCPVASGAPTPCPFQVPPSGGWGALQVQGPAFLVETARCQNQCYWNATSGDGVLSRC